MVMTLAIGRVIARTDLQLNYSCAVIISRCGTGYGFKWA